jgi:glutathione S-transferase
MMKLYYGPGACSFVPHAALEVIKAATGTDFETQTVKLHKGEQRTPEYLALNPLGLVPVLVEDGKPLNQILAICDYLDRRYPQAGLLPADPWQRAQALSMLAWMNNSVHPTFTHVFRPTNFASSEAAQEDVKALAVTRFREHLERIQAMIGHASPWLLGDKPSFADFYALVFLRWGGFAAIDPASLPAYKGFVDRVAALPAVASAMAREGINLDTYKA